MSYFWTNVGREWRRLGLPTEGACVLLAVSGGADSLALWLALDELRQRQKWRNEICLAHFNHRLRPESDADAAWVEAEAARRGYRCIVGAADVGAQARQHKDNLEQAARRARYAFLATAAESCQARYVLTAHTLDDQAETLLLNLVRGSGLDGLGAMKPLRPLSENVGNNDIWLARPLLRWARRADTQAFCQAHDIAPRVDTMNHDPHFARVRVRQELIPLLETLNPQAVATLGRTAEMLRAEQTFLDQAATELLTAAQIESVIVTPDATSSQKSGASVDAAQAELVAQIDAAPCESVTALAAKPLRVAVLWDAPPALALRALRLWLTQMRGDARRLTHAHLRGVAQLLHGTQGGRVAQLPAGGRVVRRKGWLHYETS